MGRLVRAVWRLLESLWRGDRIRISPREGLLLDLCPATILVIDGRPAEVLGRAVAPRFGVQRVLYACRTRNGAARLEIQLQSDSCRQIRWHEEGRVLELNEDDIEVFAVRQ